MVNHVSCVIFLTLTLCFQPWTTGSSHEPADRQGKSKRSSDENFRHILVFWFRCIDCIYIYLVCEHYISIIGPEEAWSVHWVFLLQHPKTCDQSPAEVFWLILLITALCYLNVSHLNPSLSFAGCSGSEALLYHLSEVKGMSLWKQKFEPLGLDSAAIEGTIVPLWLGW